MSAFFASFNAALPDMERNVGENWTYLGAVWPAISIDDLRTSESAQRGGRFRNASLVIDIRLAIAQQSGIAEDKVIQARGQSLRVIAIGTSGDDSITLTCGPVGVRT